MSWLETPLVQLLSHTLELSSAREGVISENVANVDTPGYRTKDLDFSRELHQALAAETAGAPAASPQIHTVAGLVARPDGNDVDIDRESLLMAQNQLTYQLAVQLLQLEFSRLQLAINGGAQ